jgi:sugar O-acyltransferase (sialic acid O-acetyltransferase NeuD family)
MNSHQTRILVFGARSFAEEVADLAAEVPYLRVVGFVENYDRDRATTLHGLPVYWIDDVEHLAATHKAVCGLGTTLRLPLISQASRMGFEFTPVIHPASRVSPTATVGAGSIVSAGSIIAAHAAIGSHVVINRGALIGHHSQIDDCTNIGPGANIGGACRIEAGVYVGIGATLIDHLTIGPGTVIGAGAVVTRDLPARVMAVGVPAKVIKENIEGK